MRAKEDLRIGASFDTRQSIIIKDLAYRLRLLELENQGQQAKIEKLEGKEPRKAHPGCPCDNCKNRKEK